jgi:hypothetical protein
MPSLPATTHEAEHIEQASRSLPSFVQPHLAAAAESMDSGFDVYVEGLKVPSRSRNAWAEEGEKSLMDVEDAVDEEEAENEGSLKGSALRVLAAVRARMAERWGALLKESDFFSLRIKSIQYLMHITDVEIHIRLLAGDGVLRANSILRQRRVYGPRSLLSLRRAHLAYVISRRAHSLIKWFHDIIVFPLYAS